MIYERVIDSTSRLRGSSPPSIVEELTHRRESLRSGPTPSCFTGSGMNVTLHKLDLAPSAAKTMDDTGGAVHIS